MLKIMSKMGIADVAAYCGAQVFDVARPRAGGRRPLLRRHAAPVGGIGFDELEREAPGARFASDAAGEPRLRQVPEGRRAARDGRSRGRRGARAAARRPERTGGRRTTASPSSSTAGRRWSSATCSGFAPAEPVPLDEVEPAELDRAALLRRRDVARRAVGRGARDDRGRVQPASGAVELRRGRRGSGPLPHRAQLADQAGRLGPLRRHARVRGVRRRAPDQDRAGLEARRGRPAARPQGLGRDRAPPAHDPGRRADLAAAAPRHLLDRGPRAADLRPPAGEPGRRRSR